MFRLEYVGLILVVLSIINMIISKGKPEWSEFCDGCAVSYSLSALIVFFMAYIVL